MDVDDVREVTIGSLAVALGVAAGLVLTFWVVLHPVALQSCNSSLPDSDFKRALVPAHLIAAFVASACLWLVSAARRGKDMPGAATLIALGLVWTYIGVSLADQDVFAIAALIGIFGAPTLGLVIVCVVAVRAVTTAKSGAAEEARWAEHARSMQILLWTALVLGIPANLSYAWLSGASPFCF